MNNIFSSHSLEKLAKNTMKRISNVTKRDIFELFMDGIDAGLFGANREIYPYNGRLSEIQFLHRLYPLKEMPSLDDRYDNAEDDILHHTVNNDDYPYCWVFNDDRFPLKSGMDEEYLRFICEVFHPEVCIESYLCRQYYDKINSLLRNDRYELYVMDTISNRNVYGWREITQQEAVAGGFIPFSLRNKSILEQKALSLSIPRSIRKNIISVMNRCEEQEDLVTETNFQYYKSTKEAVWDDIQKYYKPFCFDESGKYVETADFERFISYNYPEKVLDVIELFASYPSKKIFEQEINLHLKSLGWQLFDRKIMRSDKLSITAQEPSKDVCLRELILQAEANFRSSEQNAKQIAIEKIWDAFERVKSYYSANKKKSLSHIVTRISNGNEDMYQRIDSEFSELTQIGNTYQIRHFEKEKIAIADEFLKEYLYHRCLALINLSIKTIEKTDKVVV